MLINYLDVKILEIKADVKWLTRAGRAQSGRKASNELDVPSGFVVSGGALGGDIVNDLADFTNVQVFNVSFAGRIVFSRSQ